MPDSVRTAPGHLGISTERLARIPEFLQSYLDKKKLPCLGTLVSVGGEIVHEAWNGVKDWDSGEPVTPDTIFRIYSMTKPVTSVAGMILFEEGKLRLDHEVFRYIPAFKDVMVWDGGTQDAPQLRSPDRPILVRDLFTHTSGLTYGFMMAHPVDAMYRRERIGNGREDLETFCNHLASLPLVFSPGEKFNYGHSTDVLGRIVEVASGMSLDEFFKQRIFDPLGMTDTGFFVPEDKHDRLMSCYQRDPLSGDISKQDEGGAASKGYASKPLYLSGGGGLVSTMQDYHQFCRMLLNFGELDRQRILASKTMEFMTENHLPGNRTMSEMGDELFSEARMDGSGFGLGWSVLLNPVDVMQPGSIGQFSWGGMASTFFWVDPQEDLIGILMTQLMPSAAYPIRPQFQQLVYAAVGA